MKLSQLTPEQKTRLLAELDGWTFHSSKDNAQGFARPEYWLDSDGEPYYCDAIQLPVKYLTSYDAIIPLVQKLDENLINKFIYALQIDILKRCPIVGSDEAMFMASELDCWHQLKATPSQLCDAVLVATGKAEL